MVLCALGDLLLDVVVRVDGPIASDTDTYGTTRVGAGGQAANVAAWTVALGGAARFLGKRACDAAGRVAADEVRGRGVEVLGPTSEGSTGTVVSIAKPDGTRTMLTDRGVAPAFAPHELDARWLDGCACLHVPGYSLVRSPLRETALAAAALAPRVSVDASSTAAIDAVGVDAFAKTLAAVEPDVLLANEAEAAVLEPIDVETLVVKRGADGCLDRRAGEESRYAAVDARVVDSTGAGDAFAAGFLLGGAELALAAAARCVAKLGAMP